MSSAKRREQIKREKEMDFFSTKASFVAGILLWITILKNIAELYITIPVWVVICYLAFSILLFTLVLGTHLFDEKLKPRAVSNFGSFLTVCSTPYFIIENSVLKFKESSPLFETTVITLFVGVTIIAGSIFLLTYKKE